MSIEKKNILSLEKWKDLEKNITETFIAIIRVQYSNDYCKELEQISFHVTITKRELLPHERKDKDIEPIRFGIDIKSDKTEKVIGIIQKYSGLLQALMLEGLQQAGVNIGIKTEAEC